MEIKQGLLFVNGMPVRFVPTPHKRGTMKPSYLVIHYTADSNPQSTINWFQDPRAEASAHLLIDRSGNITQFGLFTEVLWHAGKSFWEGINGLNSHSIGIELTNLGITNKQEGSVLLKHKNEGISRYWQTYTDIQINVLKQVADVLVKTYSLKDIIGHDDIAPGRKQDPGPAFPWEKIKSKATYHTTSGLNLRSGPGTNYGVVMVIPSGSSVIENSRNGDWSSIVYNGVSGYVSNKYLK